LRTIRLGNFGPEHARLVIERRLEHFALGGQPRATLTPDAYAWLAATFGDDLRATIHLLYEAFQALAEPIPIDARCLHTMSPLAHARERGLGGRNRALRKLLRG
jgi:hypothetical protein